MSAFVPAGPPLGVCGVREEDSSPCDGGCFCRLLQYAFNFLLNGSGLLAPPREARRVTTFMGTFLWKKSCPLLENHQISKVTVVSPSN
jgi:hypothetical protein